MMIVFIVIIYRTDKRIQKQNRHVIAGREKQIKTTNHHGQKNNSTTHSPRQRR